MDEQTAKVVIAAGLAVGIAIWMFAVTLYRKMADVEPAERIETPVPGKTPAEAIRTVVESARQFAADARLSRPDEHSLAISQLGVASLIRAERAGGQTVLVAEVDDSALRRKMQLVLAILVLVVMPAVILGVGAALWHFVPSNPAPAVRWQAVQILQISHVLWPPFVVYGVWKAQRSRAAAAASNLMVLADAG